MNKQDNKFVLSVLEDVENTLENLKSNGININESQLFYLDKAIELINKKGGIFE